MSINIVFASMFVSD